MSAHRLPSERPPSGFMQLGDLSTLQYLEAWRLLIPLKTHDALAAARQAQQKSIEPAEDVVELLSSEASSATQVVAAPVPQRAKSGHVRIFRPEALEQADIDLKSADSNQQKCAKPLLEKAGSNDGYRALPRIHSALKKLDAARECYANLHEPIQKLKIDLTLAGAMRASAFHIRPILLVGTPGTGKTHFALKLAEALSVPMQKWSAGSAQASFQLAGADSGWRHAQPGMIIEMLAKSNSAAPVLVLDEVDKIGKDGSYPVLPVLLDLLETETARAFRDVFFRMEFDASRIICVMTANNLDAVPAPLLSRAEVFDIPAPEPEQRLQIIRAEVQRLRRMTRKHIELDAHAAKALAERNDLDLRQTHRLVTDAFATALVTGSLLATLKMPARGGRKSIGFVSDAWGASDG